MWMLINILMRLSIPGSNKGQSWKSLFKLCPVVHCQKQHRHLNYLANGQRQILPWERRLPIWNRETVCWIIFENYVSILHSLRFHSKVLASMREPYLEQILLCWLQNGNSHNLITSVSALYTVCEELSPVLSGNIDKIYGLLFNSVCHNPWQPFFS